MSHFFIYKSLSSYVMSKIRYLFDILYIYTLVYIIDPCYVAKKSVKKFLFFQNLLSHNVMALSHFGATVRQFAHPCSAMNYVKISL